MTEEWDDDFNDEDIKASEEYVCIVTGIDILENPNNSSERPYKAGDVIVVKNPETLNDGYATMMSLRIPMEYAISFKKVCPYSKFKTDENKRKRVLEISNKIKEGSLVIDFEEASA